MDKLKLFAGLFFGAFLFGVCAGLFLLTFVVTRPAW